jgi:hypothetical protein
VDQWKSRVLTSELIGSKFSRYISYKCYVLPYVSTQAAWEMTVTHPETHTKRQATQHGCLTSLMGDGDKGIEILYSEEKVPNLYGTKPTRAAKTKINP